MFFFVGKDFIRPINFYVFYAFYTHLNESCLLYLCLFVLIYAYLDLVICAQENEFFFFFLFTPRNLCTSKMKISYLCLFVLIFSSWFMIHLDKSCLFLFVLICDILRFFGRVKSFLKKTKKFKNGLITSIYYTTYVISLFCL